MEGGLSGALKAAQGPLAAANTGLSTAQMLNPQQQPVQPVQHAQMPQGQGGQSLSMLSDSIQQQIAQQVAAGKRRRYVG